MPTYVTLLNWTQKGIENISESPSRLDTAKKAMKAAGAKIKGFYMTIGQYDMVIIVEAPDDATLARVMLLLTSQGSIRSQTLKGFSEDEYREIIAQLPKASS